MKREPTPKDPGLRMKMPGHGDAGGFAASSPTCSKARRIGPAAFSHVSAVSVAEAEILRTAKAIKQAGCRDVLVIGTAEYVRFIVTIKLPNLVRR
jgi:hypothetical protein